MSPTLLGLLFSLGTAVLVIIGDVALKLAADGDHIAPARMMGLGIALYAASAILWFLSCATPRWPRPRSPMRCSR